MESKLTLYINPAWRREGLHSPLLYPFWGNINTEESLFAKEMFDAYSFDTSLYTITDDISKADMVMPPYRHVWLLRHDRALLDECICTARTAGLPLLIDGVGDVEFPIDIENAYVLRIGGYRFIPEKGRIQIPPASDDLLERCCGGTLQIRKKGVGKPVVGFAGWAKLTPLQTLRTVIKELRVRVLGIFDSCYRAVIKGVLWRAKSIGILKRSPLVALNLKVRNSFSGTAKTAEKDMRALRQDFVDTELNFPNSDILNYSEFCLIVGFRDIQKLPEKIAEFHKNISPEKYEAMQRKAREAFVKYFRIDAQMHQIVLQL